MRAVRTVNNRFPNPVTLVVVWAAIGLVVASVIVYVLELAGRDATWAALGLSAAGLSIWYSRKSLGEERAEVAAQQRFSAVILAGFALVALGQILLGST